MRTVTIFEAIEEHAEASRRQQDATWAEFVIGVADGKFSDPETILDQLGTLNKTPGDLQRAVEQIRQRRQWRATFEQGESAGAQYPALLQKRADAEAELEALIDSHHKKYEPL